MSAWLTGRVLPLQIAVEVQDRHGKPVDDSAKRRAKAAAAWAAKDRVPLMFGSDTFTGHKPTNEDRAIEFDAGKGSPFDADLGKWFGVVRFKCTRVCREL